MIIVTESLYPLVDTVSIPRCRNVALLGRQKMSANVGGVDRILRILVGIALIAWAVMGGPVWAWVGVVPLATGLVKFCPFYPLLGLSTCQK